METGVPQDIPLVALGAVTVASQRALQMVIAELRAAKGDGPWRFELRDRIAAELRQLQLEGLSAEQKARLQEMVLALVDAAFAEAFVPEEKPGDLTEVARLDS